MAKDFAFFFLLAGLVLLVMQFFLFFETGLWPDWSILDALALLGIPLDADSPWSVLHEILGAIPAFLGLWLIAVALHLIAAINRR